MMGDWSDNLEYEQREYYGHFYDTDKEEETEEETEGDLISRKDAIQALKADGLEELCRSLGVYPWNVIKMIPSVQPVPCEDAISREFEEIVLEYLDKDICPYPEYKGKPYFSIKYKENGKQFIGFSTYKPEVFSQYLKDYFMPSVQPKKGEWIPDHTVFTKCSCCGWYMRTECFKPYRPKNYHFCPNCGADMRGETNG